MVADASITPSLTSGSTDAPAIVGGKVAAGAVLAAA
jgi:hypothetical protein